MLYARTRVGEWMHQKDLQKFREQYPEWTSKVTATELGDVKIRPIPLLEDNYAYLVIDKSTETAVVVDPADAAAVKKVIEEENVRLSAIFTTHKHWDHAGGNLELRADYKHVSIYGNKKDNIPGCTKCDGMQVGNLNFRAIFTPGHTVGHTIYLLEARPGCPQCVFTGDCLFLSGCGRTFEGSCATMISSLDKICELDDTTLVWPGHEYAKDNLEFARSIEPENAAISEKLSWVKGQRLERNITSPSTVAEEKSYNPFLRTREGSVLTSLGYDATESAGADITDLRSKALAEIRHKKDSFNYKL
ncbi:putative hydrolase PNKD [Apostichopus japonicus]|uniref:Putative hydrolase PNKD n=1 Tax=Stichopus japonicus TaxID=307972 RepID=A0A2G8KA11_STIJA|nr:putative hydrolase PNKD [Apostichopus japonicus]